MPLNRRRYLGFIGTRDLDQHPREVVQLYRDAAIWAAQHGYAVRTGAAQGADQLAAEAALDATPDSFVSLVLPWSRYERLWQEHLNHAYGVTRFGFDVITVHGHDAWWKSVDDYHPNPQALSSGARALHARNYGIVQPCLCVIALPGAEPNHPGGTGQGMRVAAGLGIPCYNLIREEDREKIRRKIHADP